MKTKLASASFCCTRIATTFKQMSKFYSQIKLHSKYKCHIIKSVMWQCFIQAPFRGENSPPLSKKVSGFPPNFFRKF